MRMPVVSGRDMVKILGRICFKPARQKGSHIILMHADPPTRRITVPNHSEIKRGMLCEIIRQAGLSRDDFLDLYHRHRGAQDGQNCG